MTDMTEQEVERPGIDRRTLIKRTAAAGAVAWAAPTIIGSIASPAGAVTGGLPASCSYLMLVMQLPSPDANGNTIVAFKVFQGATTCVPENHMSADAGASFSIGCNGVTYSRCGSDQICAGGSVVPAAATGTPCPVTVNGGTITVTTGTLLFGVAHSGSCSGGGGAICNPCCGGTTCNAGC